MKARSLEKSYAVEVRKKELLDGVRLFVNRSRYLLSQRKPPGATEIRKTHFSKTYTHIFLSNLSAEFG